MLKFERKFMEWIEAHMLLFSAIFTVLLFFVAWRQSVWFTFPDLTSYFDLHEGTTQTGFFYLLFVLCMYLPGDNLMITWKWVLFLCQLIIAVESFFLCGGSAKVLKSGDNKAKIKYFLLFVGCLFAPTAYLRGAAWGREDALAFAFLLGALLAFRSSKKLPGILAAMVLAGIGCAIYPFYIWVVILYLAVKVRDKRAHAGLGVLAVTIAIALTIGRYPGNTVSEAANQLIRVLRYHPATGKQLMDAGEWLWQLLLVSAYPLTYILALWAFKGKDGVALNLKGIKNLGAEGKALQKEYDAYVTKQVILRCVIVISVICLLAVCCGVELGIGAMQPY